MSADAQPFGTDNPSHLLLQFQRGEAHLGSLGSDDNRFGICRTALLALHEWAHALWYDQPDLMAQLGYLTRRVVSTTASLHELPRQGQSFHPTCSHDVDSS